MSINKNILTRVKYLALDQISHKRLAGLCIESVSIFFEILRLFVSYNDT